MSDLVPKSLVAKMAEHKAAAKAWTPWAYQGQGLKFMLEDAQCGLLLDPGMGKTAITLAAITLLLKKRLIKRALIVAPLRPVYEVWPFEVSDWKDFNHLGVAILHGSGKDKVLRTLRPEHQIALINYEGLAWLFDSKERIRQLDADMLVTDESSNIKNSQSLRVKVLRRVVPLFKRRYILTGSPRPRNYEDLWGQIYVLDRGTALGSYISHYRNMFFYPTGFQMREWALLPDSAAAINKLVAPMVLRLDASDYLKLPGRPDRLHRVELPEKARKEYDLIEESAMSSLFNAPMVSAGAARSKLCQLANGAVYLDAGYACAQALVHRLYSAVAINPDMDAIGKDAKTELQEWLQARKMKVPSYKVVGTLGAAHKQTFDVECEIPELRLAERGIGGSRRAGEQAAAAAMLQTLKTKAPK